VAVISLPLCYAIQIIKVKQMYPVFTHFKGKI